MHDDYYVYSITKPFQEFIRGTYKLYKNKIDKCQYLARPSAVYREVAIATGVVNNS